VYTFSLLSYAVPLTPARATLSNRRERLIKFVRAPVLAIILYERDLAGPARHTRESHLPPDNEGPTYAYSITRVVEKATAVETLFKGKNILVHTARINALFFRNSLARALLIRYSVEPLCPPFPSLFKHEPPEPSVSGFSHRGHSTGIGLPSANAQLRQTATRKHGTERDGRPSTRHGTGESSRAANRTA